MIINFSVEHDPDRRVLIGHGLMPPLYVHDRQTAMSQPDRPLGPKTGPIGATMTLHIAHPDQAVLFDTIAHREIDDACNSTHTVSPLARRSYGLRSRSS